MENTRSRKVTPVQSKMMNVEVRFFALIILSVITVYIVYDTQKESSMHFELAQLNKIVKKGIMEKNQQHPKFTGMNDGMIIEGSFKKMINTKNNDDREKTVRMMMNNARLSNSQTSTMHIDRQAWFKKHGTTIQTG